MAQFGSDTANKLINTVHDAITFAPQRNAVSDWVNQKESQLKGAYQRATGTLSRALNGPTRYDYTKSKFKVSPKPRSRSAAHAKQPAKRTISRKSTGP